MLVDVVRALANFRSSPNTLCGLLQRYRPPLQCSRYSMATDQANPTTTTTSSSSTADELQALRQQVQEQVMYEIVQALVCN